MNFYLGTQDDLQSVQVPTTGLERTRAKYRTGGVLTNGGGWARSSVSGHNVYNMNWDFIRNDSYAQINAILERGDLIHFLDPQAAVSNALPSYVAQAGEAARGGYRLVGYSDTSAVSEAAVLASGIADGPRRTVAYTGIADAPRKQIWLPIPTGHTLHLRGLTEGAARIQLSGIANVLPDPKLLSATMTANGGTFNDSVGTTFGPHGTGYFRRSVVSPNTASPMTMALALSGLNGIPVQAGQDYTVSWWARKFGDGGPATRVDWNWYDASGAGLSSSTGMGYTPNTAWTRYFQTNTAPVGAAFARPLLVWTGTAVAGQDLDFADAQMEPGATATVWSDGILPAYSSGTDVPSISLAGGTNQGSYITVGAGDNITLRWLQAKVLPAGESANWGDWQPGLGHSGCRLEGDPSYTLYSAPQAIDYGALGITLRETGAWE